MILDLPDLRQSSDFDCSDACLRIVFRFFGRARSPAVATPVDGADPRALEAAFRRAGFFAQAGDGLTPLDLRFHTRLGHPVVCLVTNHDGVGHYVVVAGVARGFVHYQDPETGPGRERAAAFFARWRDSDHDGRRFNRWAIIVRPPDGAG
jgi:ABC-type bacteriocin/lantibiotic exporter with double-glycine peptidase domain